MSQKDWEPDPFMQQMANNNPTLRIFRSIGVGSVLLALAACQPTMDEVIASHRVAVQAVFDKITALEAVVANTPPVAEDQMDAGAQRVVLEGAETNALLIHADDLKAPERAGASRTGATHAGTIETCGRAMSGDAPGVPAGVDSMLRECADAEFLFILRARVDEPAEIVEVRSYRPGRFAGEVLLFRLSDGTLLGGFSVSATNNDSLMAQVDEAGVPKDLAGRLQGELSSNVFAGINAKLRKHVPGSVREDGP